MDIELLWVVLEQLAQIPTRSIELADLDPDASSLAQVRCSLGVRNRRERERAVERVDCLLTLAELRVHARSLHPQARIVGRERERSLGVLQRLLERVSARVRTDGLRVPARVIGLGCDGLLEQRGHVVIPAQRDRGADRQLPRAASRGGPASRNIGPNIERTLIVVRRVQQRTSDELHDRVAVPMCQREFDIRSRALELPALGQETPSQQPWERLGVGEQVAHQRRVEAAGFELGGETLGCAQRR